MVMIVAAVMLKPFVVMRLHPAVVVTHPPIAIVPNVMIIVIANDHWTSVSFGVNWRRRVSVTGAGSVGVAGTVVNTR